ncbi:hypothetical protein AB1Y20_015471 [Prymnesium parvum]|uniref:Tyrosine-protein kinase ephrin type A/B receptor-like domain-containing protein n=1 Tax=Prymnesium parvum TaxID=97485 RepID=A0AB34JYK4_PRYPA
MNWSCLRLLALLAPLLARTARGCTITKADLCDGIGSDAEPWPCICYVSRLLIFYDLQQCEWRSSGALVLTEGARLSCEYPYWDASAPPCSITLAFDAGITLSNGSSIAASHVQLLSLADILIHAGAAVSADGLGSCGVGASLTMEGAAHAGQGGACGRRTAQIHHVEHAAYGSAIAPIPTQGEAFQAFGRGVLWVTEGSEERFCCGGGYVLVRSTRGFVRVDGSLSADGEKPCLHCINASFHGVPSGCACCETSFLQRKCYGGSGGAGGTVAVVAHTLNGSGAVRANGADADAFCEPHAGARGGGGGGRLQLAAGSSMLDAQARGGLGASPRQSDCESGGAGTVFYPAGRFLPRKRPDGRASPNLLIIDNFDSPDSAVTPLDDLGHSAIAVDRLQVTRGAVVAVVGVGGSITTTSWIRVTHNGAISLSLSQYVSTVLLQLAVSSDIYSQSSVRLQATALMIDSLSTISQLELLNVSGNARIQGTLTSKDTMQVGASIYPHGKLSPPELQLLCRHNNLVIANPSQLLVGDVLQLDSLGSLTANKVIIQAKHIHTSGHIQAANALEWHARLRFALDCPSYWRDSTSSSYSLTILASTVTVSVGGLLAGGAVGICASNATIQGYITASGLGHLQAVGDGPGCAYSSEEGDSPPSSVDGRFNVFEEGAGSGAGHGGAGGASLSLGNRSGCAGGGVYDMPSFPAIQGSGGGGLKGGAGGGVVLDQLVLLESGELLADGDHAGRWLPNDVFEAIRCPLLPLQRVPSPAPCQLPQHLVNCGACRPVQCLVMQVSGGELVHCTTTECNKVPGSGGGSGGSILIQARNITTNAWHGRLSAQGGDGSGPGAGGGGGGLISLSPLPGFTDWEDPPSCTSPWPVAPCIGLVILEGVRLAGGFYGGDSDEDAGRLGSPGNLTGPNCSAGRFGALCQHCIPGTAKMTTGADDCALCAPGNYSAQQGATSCERCQSGWHTSHWGATSCESCTAGSYSEEGAKSCHLCSAGRYSNHSGATACASCALLGLAQPNAGGQGCVRCAYGQEKNEEGTCTNCSYAPPEHAHYAEQGTCSWVCNEPFTEINRECGVPVDVVLNKMGGWHLVLTIFMLLLALLGLLLAFENGTLSLPHRATDVIVPTSRKIFEQAAKPQLESLQSALAYDQQTLLYKQHVLRVYFTGKNSSNRPWRLPLMGPDLRRLVKEKEFMALANDINHAGHWRDWQMLTHSVLLLLMPPLSVAFASMIRRAHYDAITQVVESLSGAKSEQLWRSLSTRVFEGHRMQLGCCPRYSVAWIDIFTNNTASPPLPMKRITPVKKQTAVGFQKLATGSGHSMRDSNYLRDVQILGSSSVSSAQVHGFRVDPLDITGNAPSEARSEISDSSCSSPVALPLRSIASGSTIVTSAHHERGPSARLVHVVAVFGEGTFLAPYFLDISDFMAHAALKEAVESTHVPAIAACINSRLQQVDRYRLDWRSPLAELLQMLSILNAHLRSMASKEDGQLRVVALAHIGLASMVYGGICTTEAVSGCLTSILILPFAAILSPLYGLFAISYTLLLYHRALKLHPLALRQVASGVATRQLHSFAMWQTASLPNSAIALVVFLYPDVSSVFVSSAPWLLPLCLITTKVIMAQAIKIVVAGIIVPDGTHAAWAHWLDLFSSRRLQLPASARVSDVSSRSNKGATPLLHRHSSEALGKASRVLHRIRGWIHPKPRQLVQDTPRELELRNIP